MKMSHIDQIIHLMDEAKKKNPLVDNVIKLRKSAYGNMR